MRSLTDDEVLEKFVPSRPDGQCWNWMGCRERQGHGVVARYGKKVKAHRWSFETFVGPIGDGLLVRHLCNNPPCVNPDHLAVGTHADNKMDSMKAGTARNGNFYKTHCVNGHAFDEANTAVRSNGERTCRTCHRVCEQRRRDRIKMEAMQ